MQFRMYNTQQEPDMATVQEMITYNTMKAEERKQAIEAAHKQGIPIEQALLSPADMSEGIRVTRQERRHKMAEIDEKFKQEQDRERKRGAFIDALYNTRNERNDIIAAIVSFTTVRKDGKNVAKPKCKDARVEAQAELARINKRISIYKTEIAKSSDMREVREPSHWNRMRQRDLLVRKLLLARKGDDTDTTYQKCVWLNETFCRPTHGYPRPPYRRTNDYPTGGTTGHVREQNELARVSGEMERLAQYGANLQAKGEGHSERIERMCIHLARLNNERISLGDERTVRKVGNHFYKLMCDNRS